MRRKRRRHRPRKDKQNLRPKPAHRLRQAIAGSSESATDEGRELPTQHEHAHRIHSFRAGFTFLLKPVQASSLEITQDAEEICWLSIRKKTPHKLAVIPHHCQ